MSRDAAKRATVLTAVAVAFVVLGQTAVVAAVTGGNQPMPAVSAVPQDPSAQSWADAPSRTVTLSKQQMAYPWGGGSTDRVEVRALTNDTHVAVRLSWSDPTNDTALDAPRNYSDAAAVMFSGGTLPPITMGSKSAPVNIWYWRANWQYANRSNGGDMYVYPHPDAETHPARAAGNPLAREEYDRYAQNYYAKSFGTLTHAPTQPVTATAERTDDGWAVVFVRERAVDGQYDANFEQSKRMYLAFAVWNGSADEVNGQKSISLQFSTLDTQTGTLAAAQAGGGGGDAATSTPADAVGRALEPLTGTELGLGLAAFAVVVWLVAFVGARQ